MRASLPCEGLLKLDPHAQAAAQDKIQIITRVLKAMRTVIIIIFAIVIGLAFHLMAIGDSRATAPVGAPVTSPAQEEIPWPS